MRIALYQCRVSVPPTIPYQKPQPNESNPPQRLNFQSLNQSANSGSSPPANSEQNPSLNLQSTPQQTPQSSPANPSPFLNLNDAQNSEKHLDFQEFKSGNQADPPPTTAQSKPLNQPLNFGSSANFQSTSSPVHYAGFWQRFIATFVDWFLGFVVFSLTLGYLIPKAQEFPAYLVCDGLYRILMESSIKQATIGKIIMGLVVVDLQGKRLNFKRAAIRYIASWLSWMAFGVGFMMAGWTAKKQALPKSEWKAPSFSYGDEHGGGFSHLE